MSSKSSTVTPTIVPSAVAAASMPSPRVSGTVHRDDAAVERAAEVLDLIRRLRSLAGRLDRQDVVRLLQHADHSPVARVVAAVIADLAIADVVAHRAVGDAFLDLAHRVRQAVDVFAPGSDVNSAAPGNKYEAHSGTSFAAPVVSGIAALVMSYYPSLTAADVRKVILESATPLKDTVVAMPGEDRTIRFGELSVTGAVVNAYNALKLAAQIAANRTM